MVPELIGRLVSRARPSTLASVLTMSLMFALPLLAAYPQPKQLAGPPEAFSTMKSIDPADAGTRAHSALLPVRLEPSKTDPGTLTWRARVPIAIDGPVHLLVLNQGEPWQLQLRAPNGKRAYPIEDLAQLQEHTSISVLNNDLPGSFYRVDQMPRGDWSISIQAKHGGVDPLAFSDGFLVIADEADAAIYTHLGHRRQLVGTPLTLHCQVTQRYEDRDSYEKSLSHRLDEVLVELQSPAGEIHRLTMRDDGSDGDALAEDRQFSLRFTPEEPGRYVAHIVARGTDGQGRQWVRSTMDAIEVLLPNLDLREPLVEASPVSSKRVNLQIPVDEMETGGSYRVYAELWGKDATGPYKGVAWLGGMARVEDGFLNLGLDTRWLSRAGVHGNLELRNLRVEDSTTYIALIEKQAGIPVQMPAIPEHTLPVFKTVDEEMLMGPRPVRDLRNKAGSKLMLVHGFCSGGGTWPTNHFSNYQVFSDPNKNRSHDTFAQLIAQQGSNLDSFGVVAHSQGGAAALHLYTYYWSGLDNATGNRLIQSVGTPYQGTVLAGLIAAIGDIFGISCGTNEDMTYDGASQWLSGIPSWARQKVYYHTTSEKDVWWRWDFCHIAAEFVLDDPEDGTTEKWAGQLSGANNMGHKTGWCHIEMRDPAQVKDSSRNSNMNSNAAR